MFSVRQFKGRIPRLHNTLLPEGFASKARNCYLRRGALKPWKGAVAGATTAPLYSLLPFDGAVRRLLDVGTSMMRFSPAAVSMARGPVDTDRFYLADGVNLPRVTNFTDYDHELQMPKPAEKPTIALTSGTVDNKVDQVVKFAYTYVSSLGEESKPSLLSNGLSLSPGCTVTISGMGTDSGRSRTAKRIYRTVTDFAGVAELYFVKEVGIAVTSTTHEITDSDFQEVCPSKDYDFPRPDLRLLTQLPNGMMVAASGNKRICFCEPYQPQAWPRKYELFADSKIMGFATLGDSIVVLTIREPHIIVGGHPSVMRMQKSDEMLPCVSTRSIVDMGSSIAYASSDGLVVMGPGGTSKPTMALFTREDWQDLNPQSMFAVFYEGCYIFGHDPNFDGARLGLLDLSGEMPWYSVLEGSYSDLVVLRDGLGGLYGLPLDSLSSSITKLDAGPAMSVLWRSGRFVLPQAVNIPWGQLRTNPGDSGSSTLSLYGGHAMSLIHTITAQNAPARLPGGRLDQEFEFEINGTATVYAASFAMDVNEL